jgi:HAE1 family hydrophobic/amphiphilic exporter-1/multidrug efflux pump
LYRQFALTLSISVLLSALVALTLTPALCRLILKPRQASGGPLRRGLDAFNRSFDRATSAYTCWVGILIRHSMATLLCLGLVTLGAFGLLRVLPSGFVPAEDQGLVLASIELPDGASVERADAVFRRAERFLAKVPAVSNVITLGSLNLLTGGYSSSTGTIIATLKPWDERKSARDFPAIRKASESCSSCRPFRGWARRVVSNLNCRTARARLPRNWRASRASF